MPDSTYFMVQDLNSAALEQRILLCVANSSDAGGAASALEREGLVLESCSGLPECLDEIKRGAGVVILVGEAARAEALKTLLDQLAGQPAWSDLPVVVGFRDGEETRDGLRMVQSAGSAGNVTRIEVPFQEGNLINVVRVALRGRLRQYAVRDLLEQHQAILISIHDPFVVLDRDLRFIYVNDKAAKLRGRQAQELLGKRKWEVFPELENTPYGRALQEAAEKGETRRVEYSDPLTERWYEERIYPSRAGVSVFVNDITERKQAEEALRQSEKRFRLMVESAVEYAIFSMDPAGVITSWNKGAERLLGYSEDEIVGKPVDRIFTPEDRKNGIPHQELDQVQEAGQVDDERWHVRKDKSRFWASGQVMPMMDEGGEVSGYVKILRDYTGRKRAETWLRALNETLEKRVAERTAEAEHRAGQLQMLAAELTEAEERERRRLAELLHDHLQQILVAAKMQVNMLSQRELEAPVCDGLKQVDGLLKRSIDASRTLTVQLSPPILYDAGLAPALHWLSRRMLEDHNLKVSIEAQEGADPESENVRAFVFQTVRELLFNIVKHANVGKAEVELLRTNGDVEAVVKDDGVGFDPEARSKATTGGFGLFSIGERVGLLGGSIKIETAPGTGTRVAVRVPHRQPERQPVPGVLEKRVEPKREEVEGALAPHREPHGGRIRILLADDHKILREGLAGLLRDQPDFEVVSEASDGQMAVEMAREARPDVVVMDVSMPRLNGVEATRKILEELPSTKIIALSMHAQEDMAEAMRQAGAIDYVTKGAPSEILTAAIREAGLAASQSGK